MRVFIHFGNRVLTSITKCIEKKLGLKVNAEKSKVSKPTGIKFLGYGFWIGERNGDPNIRNIIYPSMQHVALSISVWIVLSIFDKIY